MIDHIKIRPATENDVDLLFKWRNDEQTRRMSKNNAPVPWDEHLAWLDRRLKMSRPNLFVFEMGGQPVATFRIDDKDLSYTVAPEHRGRGIAKLMLNEVRLRFGCLRAQISSANVPSIKAARTAGMQVVIIDS
jgi:RimJ/RimL family protein N-acetyltransferase